MSALADALVAAQRRALTALEKAYVAGTLAEDRMREILDLIGTTDAVDQDRLIASLDVIRLMGASLPAEPVNGAEKASDAPMSPKQSAFIDKLWRERGGKPAERPDTTGLTQEKASELITQLRTNTYDPAAWSIPF